MDFFKLTFFGASLFLLSGCPHDPSSKPDSADTRTGITADFQVNIHNEENKASVAAAVFDDSRRVNLIAGDVFEATTETNSTLLKSVNVQTGDYIGTLPIDDPGLPITIKIQHKPIETREDRWYPVDVLHVDPGPGNLVGREASVSFPPPVTITGPDNTAPYIDINDPVYISWVDAGVGANMRLTAAVSCTNGNRDFSYGVSYFLGPETGSDQKSMRSFIYNPTIRQRVLGFAGELIRVLMAGIIEVLTFGLVDADDLDSSPINIETADCDIILTLIREKEASFNVNFDDVNAIGSTSASTTIRYRPIGF